MHLHDTMFTHCSNSSMILMQYQCQIANEWGIMDLSTIYNLIVMSMCCRVTLVAMVTLRICVFISVVLLLRAAVFLQKEDGFKQPNYTRFVALTKKEPWSCKFLKSLQPCQVSGTSHKGKFILNLGISRIS